MLWAMIALGMTSVNAQNQFCDDPCPPGPLMTHTITLCTSSNAGLTAPSLFVIINYRLRNCNGTTSIIIEDYVVVDARLAYIGPPYNLNIDIPCSWTLPLSTSTDFKNAATAAINELITKLGNPAQSNYDVYFLGACVSFVQLSFPDSAFIVGTPDDLGNVDTMYLIAGSTITHAVKCSDVCCKATYKWQTVTLANGLTIQQLVPISYEGDGGQCENQPIPDYNNVHPKFEATKYDPVTGQYTTVTGTVVSQSSCESMCPSTNGNPPTTPLVSIKTDINLTDEVLQLKLSPVPFNNYIQITANRTAEKIVVYDKKGKKILTITDIENGMLNTTDLKPGTYFMQVHFDSNIIKTLKAIKE